MQALSTGMVLLGDPLPSLPGRRVLKFPVAWQEALAFIGGWAMVGLGGLCIIKVSGGRSETGGACTPPQN